MWFLLIFTVMAVQGSLISLESNENTFCDEHIFQACTFDHNKNFPETPEEVELFCRDIISHHYCVSDYLASCEVDENVLPFREIFDSGVLLKACDKEFPIYKLLEENAKCIADLNKNMTEHGFCVSHLASIQEEMPDILEKMQGFTNEDEDVNKPLSDCLGVVFGVGCLVTEANRNCGERAAQLLMWFVQKSKMLKNKCNEEYEPTVQAFKTLLKFDLKK